MYSIVLRQSQLYRMIPLIYKYPLGTIYNYFNIIDCFLQLWTIAESHIANGHVLERDGRNHWGHHCQQLAQCER